MTLILLAVLSALIQISVAQSPTPYPTSQPNQSDQQRRPRWAQSAGIAILIIVIVLVVCCCCCCCFKRQLKERYEIWKNPDYVPQRNNNNGEVMMSGAPVIAAASLGGAGMVYGPDGKPVYQ
jgi:hypothetical protein